MADVLHRIIFRKNKAKEPHKILFPAELDHAGEQRGAESLPLPMIRNYHRQFSVAGIPVLNHPGNTHNSQLAGPERATLGDECSLPAVET